MSPSRRFSPRDWSLRVRLAVVLLVPGILAMILGGLRIADQTGEAGELDRVARFATAQGAVADLVERVSQERYDSTTFVAGGRSGDADALRARFAEIETTRAGLEPVLTDLYADDPALPTVVRQADQALARLADVRALVLTSNAPASAVVARYSGLVDQLAELDDALLRGVNTAEVNGLATGLAGLSAARNEASLQYALVGVAADGTAELQASDARMRTALADFRTALDPGQRVRYGTVIAGAANTARAGLVQGVLADPGAGAAGAPAVFDAVLGELDAAEDGVRTELAATATERRTAAANLAGVNAVLLLLALLVGAAIVGLIARAMLTSLRTLRASAMDVADRRLPEAVAAMRSGSVPDVDVEPVPVTSREEVGEVARAFDAVHAQAVRLAAEQATLTANVNRMFVNLSRRSQTLVDRQLQLIEDLESNEQDPDQLSNLFRLDHLATRMRRNSENLLVLAGTDLAKRSAQHVPVIDVLQAAVSEVERYERITVEPPPPLAILGRAANDVQHLLSELLDNATNFSPPDSQVRMAVVRSGGGPLVVEITDVGVGMPAAELAEANRALSRRNEVGVTTSRRMGLFVVARLAARHDIEVRLVTGAGLTQARVQHGGTPTFTGDAGITARVAIPAHLVVGATPRPRPQAGREVPQAFTPQPARDGAGHTPSHALGSPPAPNGSPEPAFAFGSARAEPSGGAGLPALPTRSPRPEPAPAARTSPASETSTAAQTSPAAQASPAAQLAPAAQASPGPLPTRPSGTRPDPGRAGRPSGPPADRFGNLPEASSPAEHEPRRPTFPARPAPAPGGGAWWERQPEPAAPEAADGTPIFEEVSSGWFRSYRDVPINWQDDPAATPEASSVPEPRQEINAEAFASPADVAQTAARDSTRAPVELDANGLPRRTPGAQLVPGSVPAPTPARPSRDPDAVRDRLGGLQRAARDGRGGPDDTVDAGRGGTEGP